LKIINRFGFLLIILWLHGCATLDGPRFNEVEKLKSEEHSTLLLFRSNALKGAAWPHSYYIDGILVANLNAGGFTQLLVDGGERIVSTGPEKDKFFKQTKVNFKAGQTYYIREFSGDSVTDSTQFVLMKNYKEEDLVNYRYQSPIIEKFVTKKQ
jgi:Protein of unknown function (DUF2846).